MYWINAYPKWMLTLIVILNFQASIDFARGSTKAQAHNNILQCPKTLTCRGRCTDENEKLDMGEKSFRQVHCHCDRSCSKYNDCCHDLPTACPNRSSPLPNTVRYSCRKLNDDEPRYWMVEHCPPTFKDKIIREKCENNSDLRAETFYQQIPVISLIGKVKVSYKNEYCAKCHQNNLMLTYFDLKIKCNVPPPKGLNNTQTLRYLLKYCNRMQFKLGNIYPRRFCFPTKDSCPASASAEERKACLESPVGVVYSRSKGKNYRSMACMACHVNSSLLRQAECGPQTGKDNIFNPSSFEVVMVFKRSPFDDSSGIQEVKTTEKCNEKTHVYDQKLEMCRKDLVKPTKGVTDKFEVKMWLIPVDGTKPVNFSRTEFVEVLAHRFVPLDADQVDGVSVDIEDRTTAVLFNLRAKHHDVNKRNKTNEALDLDRLINFKQPFNLTLVKRPWLVFKVNTRRLSCTHKEEYPAWAFKKLPNNDPTTLRVEIGGKIRIIPKNQVYFYQDKNATAIDQVTIVICRSFFTVLCNHSMLALVDKEYTIFKNKSLLFKPTGQWFNEGEYDTRGNTPWICINYTISKGTHNSTENSTKGTDTEGRVKYKTDIHFEIRRYMTIIGLSISVISLFLVLLTHGILRDLRAPLPGKNLMSLSFSLFLAHFWWLLGSGDVDKPVFCRFTAYFLHYLFLVTFGCTFIVAYDTRRTFSAKTGKAHGLGGYFQNKRLAAYLLISWGIPFVFVTICALLDGLDAVAIGYGKGLACWIENPTALLIVFATPVGLVLVYNVVAFSQTVYAINSARKHGQRVKSSHYTRPATVKIYMRLTSLMGFSWFFAISAPLIHHGLMYPFVFFTTLQGLYIFLAFVFKTKVLRMIKAKLPLDNRGPSSSSSSSRRGTKGTMSTMADTTPYNKYTQSPKDDTQI